MQEDQKTSIFFEESFREEEYVLPQEPRMEPKIVKEKNVFEKVIFNILLLLFFLMPVFFLPLSDVPSGFSKNVLLAAGVFSGVFLTLFLWLRSGSIVFLKSRAFSFLFFVVLFSSFSSFVSTSSSGSFFGGGAEITTSSEFLLMALLGLLCALFFRSKESTFYALLAVFFSAIFVFAFQIFHIIFPTATLFFNVSPAKTANLIGEWGDFGIFSGVIIILSLVALELLPQKSKKIHSSLFVFLMVALFFHTLTVYGYSWVILTVVTTCLSILIFFRNMNHSQGNISERKNHMFSVSFMVACFSAALIFFGSSVNEKLFNAFNITPFQDVRPSWSGTYEVTRAALLPIGRETFVGVGPNRFFVPWQAHRPKEVNYTPWWAIDFNEGVGMVPSFLATSGVLGFLAWIFFILTFFVGGLFSLRKNFGRLLPFTQYVAVSSFAAASYLWIALSTGTGGVVPLTFAFVFTGLFLGILSGEGILKVREYNYFQDPRRGFAVTTVLILLVGVLLMFGHGLYKRTSSFFAYRSGVLFSTKGDFEKADEALQKAIVLFKNDAYYRSFSILHAEHAQGLLSRTDIPLDELRVEFERSFRASVDSANKAIEIDNANYLNWAALGNAYSILAPLGIENISTEAYVKSKEAYERSALRNPFNPQIPYVLAKIALGNNHIDEAETYAKKSIELKNDHADALILLSQVYESRGQSQEALSVIENGVSISSDPKILFQLGYLRYKGGDYKQALIPLERAVQLIPDYSNAKYFLGLAYFSLGKEEDALKEFRDIQRLNPERKDIAEIVTNIQNGHAPLSTPIPKDTPFLEEASGIE